MVVNGWTLLFHEALIGQAKTLADAYRRARRADAKNFRSNASVKLFAALAKLLLEIIPADPTRPNAARPATRAFRRLTASRRRTRG